MMANHDQVARLLKTARGQIDGILKMINEDRYCVDVSTQLQATCAILKKTNAEVIRAHLEHCVADSFASGSEAERGEKIAEIMRLIERGA
jgi:DNA-binding FrmR family transcriptional regulator